MFLLRTILFLLLLCCGIDVYAQKRDTVTQEKEDTVWLNSNQVLVGELKSINRGIVRLDEDILDILRIKYSKVLTITTNYNEYRIELIDRNVYYGHLDKSADSGKVQIVNDSGLIREVYLEEISKLIRANAGFFSRFTGSIGAGFLYSHAEKTGLSATLIGIAYQAKRVEVNLAITTMTGYNNDNIIRPREVALLDANYYFNKAWFTSLIGGYHRLLLFGVTHRFQEGVCIGNKFLQRPKMRGRIMTGFLYTQDDYILEIPSKNNAFIPVWLQLDLFSFGNNTFDVHTDQIPMFGLNQNGRFRHDGDLILTWGLFGDNVTFNLIAYDNYDSEPPVFKNKKFDFGIVFLISFSF